eukprot:scaffold3227_cov214-Amphora_coffeaeformis.AAC.2
MADVDSIDKWMRAVLDGALYKKAVTVVLMHEDGFEEVPNTRFGDDNFQYLCLTLRKKDEKDEQDGVVEVYRMLGPGPHYGKKSFAEATEFLFEDDPPPECSLYVYSGDLGEFRDEAYSFEWGAFVSAARATRRQGPWLGPLVTTALEKLHQAVQKRTEPGA